MNIDTYFNTEETTPLYFVCFFILDRLNSVGISELNIIFDVFILVWRGKKMIPFGKCFCFDIQIGMEKSEDETGNKN